jgi:hypothetical protein
MIITDPHPAISIFNFHYAYPPIPIAQNFHLNKVIGDNETGFEGTADSTYRKEGWAFMLAGGGLYNNLDYSFTPTHEDGTFQYYDKQPGGGSVALRKQLGVLKNFIESFDFIRMKPDSSFTIKKSNSKVRIKALAEQRAQYAFHISGGKNIALELPLPAGKYEVFWINTVTGNTMINKDITSTGEPEILTSPSFETDIALKILRKK